jgi:hypothetical protein
MIGDRLLGTTMLSLAILLLIYYLAWTILLVLMAHPIFIAHLT